MANLLYDDKKHDQALNELARQLAAMLIEDGYKGAELRAKLEDYLADEFHELKQLVRKYLSIK